jgi:hypothetical protein
MTEISPNLNEVLSDKDSETSSSTPLIRPKQGGYLQPNRNGRPPGSKNRITQAKLGIEAQLRDQLHEYMPEVLTKAIEMALKGDRAMLKLLLELTISKALPVEDVSEGKDKVQVTIRRLNIEQAQVELTPPKPELIEIEAINVEK